jgi:TRAP-type C4-dicarboxylate transport system permease small subunit
MDMGARKGLGRLEKITTLSSGAIEWLGMGGILLMFLVNFVDVVGAKLFLWPVPGATEVIGLAQIVAIAPAIAMALLLNRHIRVEFILMRLPKRFRATLSCISSFFGLTIFVLIAWQSYLYGHSLRKAGEIGSTSHIPFFPFAYLIAFCSLPVCLVFLIEVFKSLAEVLEDGSG